MVGRVIRRPKAEDDLVELWVYIAIDNAPAADRFLDRLERAFATLADFPLSGRSREELSPGLRSRAVGNYVIFYTALADGIELVRVVSGFRDIDTDLFD